MFLTVIIWAVAFFLMHKFDGTWIDTAVNVGITGLLSFVIIIVWVCIGIVKDVFEIDDVSKSKLIKASDKLRNKWYIVGLCFMSLVMLTLTYNFAEYYTFVAYVIFTASNFIRVSLIWDVSEKNLDTE